MKIKSAIYAMLAAVMTLTSCSDNYDDDYKPESAVRTLTLKVESDSYSNERLNLGASRSTTEVTVESNTRWAVEVADEGGWCEVDRTSGSKDGSFTITVRDNMDAVRYAKVTVYKVDAAGVKESEGSRQIDITQEMSNVRLSPNSLEDFPASDSRSQEFDIVSNVAWTLTVNYQSEGDARFITITPLTGMSEEGDGTFSGTGDARFSMSLAANRTAAKRTAILILRSDVATYSVDVSQLGSEYTFDVSPSESQVVAAEGGTIRFGVLSLSDWYVTQAPDWITFSPSEGEKSDNRVETTATILPNTGIEERHAEIYFQPRDEQYQRVSVTVVQRAFSFGFTVSPYEGLGIISEGGETRTLSIDSRFDWSLELPSWVRADRTSGSAALSEQTVTLTIEPNTTNANRTGTVKVIPQTTPFGSVVDIAPASVGVDVVSLSVTQFGGREPAVSVPWLVDGYTQTAATVEFNYYSPFYDITSAGVEWRREDSAEWTRAPFEVTDPKEGTVSVYLTGLNAATRYIARGYVVYSDGMVKTGAPTVAFSTAGQRPAEDDNQTPD